MNGVVGADGDPGTRVKKTKKREIAEEHPLRVSDRGNKGMASTTFVADWISTHFEPKDDTEGEVASKVYDLYFNECVRRQDAALELHSFINAALKVFPTISRESRVPQGRKTKKLMFVGLSMRPESPYYSLTNRKKQPKDKDGKEKSAFILKEFEEKVVEGVTLLDKPGGVGVSRLKRHFMETAPDYHVDARLHVLINALERMAYYGKIKHVKGVGAMGFYSSIKTENEEIKDEQETDDKSSVDEEDKKKTEKETEKDGDDDGADEDKEEEKDFEVEKILNRKKSKGQWLYLVRWLGFEEKDDTWEPLDNLKGSEEILQECSKEILKAERRDKAARKKAWKQRQSKAWEPGKRNVLDHLKFVLTACTDPYAASVGAVKKYVAEFYPEFDVNNKTGRFKQAMERLDESGKLNYVTGKGLSGNVELTDEGLAFLGRSSATNIDNMILEGIVGMAEPKGAAMSKIKKYFAEHLPSLKTAERPKVFKKSIEAAVKKGILYQVSGLGLTGSYQLMDPYKPPPATIQRILSDNVWNDGEYSDVEVKEAEDDDGDDDDSGDEPVYKPRASTQSGRKVTVTQRKQAPVNVPRPKSGAKRKSAATSAKTKYADTSIEQESESESEEEIEEPPKKRGKQAPAAAKRGKAAASSGRGRTAAPAKKASAASPRGGRGGARGGRGGRGAVRTPAKNRASSSEEEQSEEESIASDFEDHPPPITTPKGKGSGRGRGGRTPVKSPGKKAAGRSPVKSPSNKAAKKAVPVAIGRGSAGRNVRVQKAQFYGTPSPEYDDSDMSVDEAPLKKKAPAKKRPAKKAPPTPSKKGRGAAKPQSYSDSEHASDEDSDVAPPPPKGRGRAAAKAGRGTPKKATSRGRGRGASASKRRRDYSDSE